MKAAHASSFGALAAAYLACAGSALAATEVPGADCIAAGPGLALIFAVLSGAAAAAVAAAALFYSRGVWRPESILSRRSRVISVRLTRLNSRLVSFGATSSQGLPSTRCNRASAFQPS